MDGMTGAQRVKSICTLARAPVTKISSIANAKTAEVGALYVKISGAMTKMASTGKTVRPINGSVSG
jgi:hypothetical protein